MDPTIITLEDVTKAVASIEREFQIVPGLILTECDAQCLLYERLRTTLNERARQHIQTDSDQILASPIHTEIKILDENMKLLLRPDIVVMSERSLSLINDNRLQLIEKKGFILFGSAVFIELKFCKAKKGITNQINTTIEKDCAKLDDIKDRLYPTKESAQMLGCVVVFNRTDKRCAAFDEQITRQSASSSSKIIYATGNFAPTAA